MTEPRTTTDPDPQAPSRDLAWSMYLQLLAVIVVTSWAITAAWAVKG